MEAEIKGSSNPYTSALRDIFLNLNIGKNFKVSNLVELLDWGKGRHADASEFFDVINQKVDHESEASFQMLSSSFQLI